MSLEFSFSLILMLVGFAAVITVHELAHAWMADRLGDPTPRLMGRLSLNPLVHYDPIGTTLLFGLLVLRAFGVPVIPFGWAKPVVFDPYNLKNPRRDAALISFAGPFSNFAMATIFALVLRLIMTPFSPFSFFANAIADFILLNVILGLFNLVPIHPLDGGKILIGILPKKEAYQLDRFLNQYGMILLLILIFPFFSSTPPIFIILGPILKVILGLLIPGNPLV